MNMPPTDDVLSPTTDDEIVIPPTDDIANIPTDEAEINSQNNAANSNLNNLNSVNIKVKKTKEFKVPFFQTFDKIHLIKMLKMLIPYLLALAILFGVTRGIYIYYKHQTDNYYTNVYKEFTEYFRDE